MAVEPLRVALVGNPNAGKSTLFNALTGMWQRVGNYPGVTVELKKGTLKDSPRPVEVVDLPGTYSLAARSPDEMVAVDFMLGRVPGESRPDRVVCVVDASNLDRHLYLASQVMELKIPVILAVNMIDIAKEQGIVIDFAAISARLGIPVVPVQANKGSGIDELRRAILADTVGTPTPVPFPEAFVAEETALRTTLGSVPTFLLRRLLLDVGGSVETALSLEHPTLVVDLPAIRARLAAAGSTVPAVEAKSRYPWIRGILNDAVVRPNTRKVTFSDRLDRVLTHRIWGTLVFLAMMFFVFQAIFVWASPLMARIDAGREWLSNSVRDGMEPGPLRSLLADGILKGVGSVLVFLPQILILFAFIAVLEDCGYMARAAFLMDRIMSRCGLNGKSFIPLLSSVACAVPGIMAARVIENTRDRLATILVAPLMSCSARLPLYMLVIGAFLSDPWWLPGVALFGMYMIGLITAPLVALVLKRTLLRGATPVFVMEMPAFRMPMIRTVVRRMLEAGWAFVMRAGTMILASMVLIWALLYFPGGSEREAELQPRRDDIRVLQAELDSLPENDPTGEALRERLEADLETGQSELDAKYGEWKRETYLGQIGVAMEPVFAPLGWDWKIGMAALASFPAREVVVGTLGIIYNQGEVDPKTMLESNPGDTPLGKAIREEWKPHRVLTALSLLVFFALCCQCVSTLAVIKRETRSWRWPIFTFVYMTTLAYVGALLVFQIGRLFV